MVAGDSVRRVTLTASGGALRGASDEAYASATAEEALAHPTWDMGAKVTVDCATLVNKGLELIEAHWLFGLGSDRLDVVVHPQSIVHALVEMVDGSVIAQVGATDMRTAIQAALTWPERAGAPAERLDLARIGSLTFAPADEARHIGLRLARRVIEEGGTLGAALTAANEEAVAAFLAGRIPLGRVPELAQEAMERFGASGDGDLTLEAVENTEAAAREHVRSALGAGTAPATGRE
jgi:1-deoxy-D-xylulose-5-phosphate reductoisomerase